MSSLPFRPSPRENRQRQALLAEAFEGVELLGLVDAARLMRGKVPGKPPHPQTVRRWCNPKKGYRATRDGGGEVAVLQTVRLSGCLYTTAEWVCCFESRRLLLGTAGTHGEGTP